MASNHHNENPWEDQHSEQRQSYQNHNSYQAYQEQPQNPYTQQAPQGQNTSPWAHGSPGLSQNPPTPLEQPQQTAQPPYQQQQQPYQQQPYQQQQPPQPSYQQQPSQHPYAEREEVPPSLPPRRTATDLALPTGQDRSHQIEVMQSYQAAGRKDEDDSNVEELQREFPKIDGSLIAAIYGDSKSLSATREMLQALE